jgi:threonyl-tRNA synthetase
MNKINITFPDGITKEYNEGITGLEIAKSISPKIAKFALAVKINGTVIDLNRPLTKDTSIKFLSFNDEEGQEVYWHSTSHLMAHAVQELYPEAKFGVGPAIDAGFYYDIDINSMLHEDDLKKIEDKMIELSNQDEHFKRVELSKNKAIGFFKEKGDEYKLELLSEMDENNEVISIYNEGSFTDLCRGPHLPSTGKIKYVKLLNISGSYWRGDEKNKQLQRIYGISFPKKSMLDEFLHTIQEAKKRDHRKLGKQLDLFSIHEEAGAGLIYWHPKGSRIRSAIEDYWRKAHQENGYELLYSPHLGKSWLWERSGHLDYYKESMFAEMDIDEQDYYIKPMNCPFHIMIYKTKLHSYRDLPLRWAELGTVYRYEKSGVLHGLMRVRGFTQDDAHIFCTYDQVESELIEVIRFANMMLKSFGFEELKFYLSTKPEKAVGADELWQKAEDSLKIALENEKIEYEIDEGAGVFYGPKIDIKIKDALKREWQMSTIQFDFNLPERFSIERFFGVLLEHFAGDFPVWLAPVQVAVIPVSQNYFEYAEKVTDELKRNNLRVELDKRNEKIGYKIRDWEIQKVPYMLILGEKEQTAANVSVRKHKMGDTGALALSDFIDNITAEILNKNFTIN